jgi:hypothetical protein
MRQGQTREAGAMTTTLVILERMVPGRSLGTGTAEAPSETTTVRVMRKQHLGDQGSDRASKYLSIFHPWRLTPLWVKKKDHLLSAEISTCGN